MFRYLFFRIRYQGIHGSLIQYIRIIAWLDEFCRYQNVHSLQVELHSSAIYPPKHTRQRIYRRTTEHRHIGHYGCEKAKPPMKRKPTVWRPPTSLEYRMFVSPLSLDMTVKWFMWHYCYCSQYGRCWWSGAYLAPGHLKASWWRRPVGPWHECYGAMIVFRFVNFELVPMKQN